MTFLADISTKKHIYSVAQFLAFGRMLLYFVERRDFMLKKIKVLAICLCFFVVPFAAINAMERKQENKIEDKIKNVDEFKNTIDEYVNIISKKTEDFKLKWDGFLMQLKAKKEMSEENLEDIALTYFKIAKDIHLDKEKFIDLNKVSKDLSNLNCKLVLYKLDKEDIEKIKTAFVEQQKDIKEALKKFNEEGLEYERRLKAKIDEQFYAKDRIKQFKKNLDEKADKFESKWNNYVQQCADTKRKLNNLNIESFALMYVEFEKDICLNNAPKFCDREVDEEKVYGYLVDFDKVFLKYKLDERDKILLTHTYKCQVHTIMECLDFFNKLFGNYKETLNKKIEELKQKGPLNTTKNVVKSSNRNSSVKEKIKAYLERLEDISKLAENIWGSTMISFSTKNEISDDDIEGFATAYVLLSDEIFLDVFGEVDEKGFLKKLSRFDNGVYSYNLTKEYKEELKSAFISKVILINGLLETGFKEHDCFRNCKKKFDYSLFRAFKKRLSDSINRKLHSNLTIEFLETLFKNIMKVKIETYLKALLVASKQFKKAWNSSLSKIEGKNGLSDNDLESLVSTLSRLTNYIFLDVYGDVDKKNFRERLGTTKRNNFRYINGYITLYNLDKYDIQKLKEAFVAQIEVIREALKQFYEKYIKYKDRLNAKINEKLPLKIRLNIRGKLRTKKEKVEQSENEADSGKAQTRDTTEYSQSEDSEDSESEDEEEEEDE